MIPTWLEVHVDDLLLEETPSAWPEAAALLDALAAVAEQEGGHLSFRPREAFARGDTVSFVESLVARGHEVGWHAHASRLKAAADAVVAAGGTVRACAPGLVQAGRSSAERTLAEAQDLGAQLVTDRLEPRDFAYAGWLLRWAKPGLLAMDVSVAPSDWRLGHPDGPDFARLATLRDVQAARVAPTGTAPFFGATFHEHDVCAPGSLTPRDLDGLRRFVAACQGTLRPSLEVADELTTRAVAAPRPELAPAHLPTLADALGVLGRLGGRARAWGEDTAERAGLVPAATHRLRVGAREVRARRAGPSSPEAAVVVVHGGESGLVQGMSFLGLPDDAFARLAVWTFARTPAGSRAPGNPVHVADTRAVLEAARAEGVAVGILSWSGGLVNALLAADERVPFLIDCEGPVDRFSLVPPNDADPVLATTSVFDDAAWQGREAVELLWAFRGRYLRVQGRPDHQHGVHDLHARRVEAFGERVDLRGPLEQRGGEIRDRLERWMVEAATATPEG